MNLQPQELRLELDHITLAAKVWGPEDGEPVIALHGWLDNAASFDRIAAHLNGIRLVALDLPGHGYSQHRPRGVFYHMVDNAFDIIAAADALGWERFALLGHSMGGIVSGFISGSFPERVSRLALIESLGPFVAEPSEAPLHLTKAVREMEALPGKTMPCYPSFEDAVQARLRGVSDITEEAAEVLVSRGLVLGPQGYSWCTDPRLRMNSAFRMTEPMVEAFFANIECPVSLVIGKQGFFPKFEHYKTRLSYLKQKTVHEFDGGHHLHMESAADQIAGVLNEFLVS